MVAEGGPHENRSVGRCLGTGHDDDRRRTTTGETTTIGYGY
jgi:hypothetical protein